MRPFDSRLVSLGAPARAALVFLVCGALAACGAAPATRAENPAEPLAVAAEDDLSAADGREIRLVGRYGHLRLDVHFGDPAEMPGYVVVWVGRQPVRLGLEPRPAEERDRLLDETVEVRGLFQLRSPPVANLAFEKDVSAMPLLIPVISPRALPQPNALNLPLTSPLVPPTE